MPKKQNRKQSVSAIIDEQLATLGAAHLPPAGRRFIDADVHEAIHALIKKRVNGEYVGRMVAAGLTAAAQEGFEGEDSQSSPSTSPSSGTLRVSGKYQKMIAGQAIDPSMAHDDAAAGRRQNDATGDVS